MNIDPLSTSSHLQQAKINGNSNSQGHATGKPAEATGFDRVSTELSGKVRARLAELPEIRPEVVERGRKLLADPNYPSQDIVRRIASLITPLPEG